MLKGETILCLSPTSWFSLWRNRQQIMSKLASENTVLFVEPQRNYKLSFLETMRRNAGTLIHARIRKVNEGLFVITTPPAIPYGVGIIGKRLLSIIFPLITRLNKAILVRYIKSILLSLKIREPVLWLWSPFQVGLVGKFGEKLSCYHVYDEIAKYPFYKEISGLIERYDKELSQSVDLVFASSMTQAQRRKKFNQDTYFIPNGVNFEHFNKATDQRLSIPADIREIAKPIIGFIGLLGFQIDLSLLVYISERLTNCSLVLIGPAYLASNNLYVKLKNRHNVFFLWEKSIETIPGYLKEFDVAIMPYDVKNSHVGYSYPLKLHEYLAAGKPIVSVPMLELQHFQDVVYLADSPGSFVHRIEQAMQENSDKCIQQRINIAQANTWDQRIEEISRLILSKLNLE